MMEGVLLALLGAVFGLVLPSLVSWIKIGYHQFLFGRRLKLTSKSDLDDWLLRYYDDDKSDLYEFKSTGYSKQIPFLVDSNSIGLRLNSFSETRLIKFLGVDDSDFPVDHRIIRRRRALGQRLFNEKTLYAESIVVNKRSSEIFVKECYYFQMLTLLSHLEDETFSAIRKKRVLKHRNAILKNFPTASKLLIKPISIGCQVVIALSSSKSYDFIIQTRSHSTITFGGSKSVIPSFGMSPINKVGFEDSNLLLYNFLKEYCEELFNYEDLITVENLKRPDPFWFYNLPEAAHAMTLLETQKAFFECLGYGFDGLNGSINLAMIFCVTDPKASEEIKRNIVANWEVESNSTSNPSIEFVDYKSDRFGEWMANNEFHYSGAFALSEAIKRLDNF